MCDIVVDVEVEAGTVMLNGSDPEVIECESGRVILSASAHYGNLISGTTSVPVGLNDGALSNSCTVSAGVSGTVHYYLTTGRVATL